MTFVLHAADYVIVCLMMASSAGVGIYFRLTGGRQKTTLEFLMADKNMTVMPVAFSIMATLLSAIATLGIPAEVYQYGTQLWIREFFYPIATLMVAYFILPVYFENDVKTIYGYLEKRFGKVIMITASLSFVVQMILYIPVVLYAPSLALNVLTGISMWTCVISMAAVCTFYSALGGLKAVLWTDLFQGMLMYSTLFALIIKGTLASGGFFNVFKIAGEGQRLELFNTSMDLTVRHTLWNNVTQGLILSLYMNGSTFSMVQRLMSCGNLRKAQLGLFWSIPLCWIFKSAVCLLGITMYSYFSTCDPLSDKEISSVDQMVPFFVLKLFGHIPGLSGLCIAGILSAALSTMSSVVNCLIAVTLEDYIRPVMKHRKFKESTAIVLAKMLALFYGGLCLLLTFVIANVKGLIEATVNLLGLVGGPTFGIFFLGMFTTTANESGALTGLLTGISFAGWIGFGSMYSEYKYPPFPLSTSECSTNVNGSFEANFTWIPDVHATRSFNATPSEERYILPLYKISYLWIATIGFLTTAVVGYVLSLIIGCFSPKKEVDPKHLSPVVRKWLCKVPESIPKEECIELVQSLNQNEKNLESDEKRNEKYLKYPL